MSLVAPRIKQNLSFSTFLYILAKFPTLCLSTYDIIRAISLRIVYCPLSVFLLKFSFIRNFLNRRFFHSLPPSPLAITASPESFAADIERKFGVDFSSVCVRFSSLSMLIERNDDINNRSVNNLLSSKLSGV